MNPTVHVDASLQRVTRRLTAFWEDRGCATLPPCSLSIAASILHPKTFFQLLDDEPWSGLVVQPVCRWADARRGVHPFRTSVHLQLHVARVDPDPRGVRDAVLESLWDLGVDRDVHHLRLDDWAWTHDAVGAAGRGWRLTLDGIGIGRITFLHRLGGVDLSPDGAEGDPHLRLDVTYGIEHLAMALAGVDSVYRLSWRGEADRTRSDRSRPDRTRPDLSYDRLRRRDEEEASRYVEEVASVEHLRGVLDGLEREAERCRDAGLVRPTYERAIEGLSILDLLELRGDVSPREREGWDRRIRHLVSAAAELHLSRSKGVAERVKEAAEEDRGAESDTTETKEATAKAEKKAEKKPRRTKKTKESDETVKEEAADA